MAEYHEVTAQLLTTQLVQAAETGDVALLRALLTDHPDLASRGPRGGLATSRARSANIREVPRICLMIYEGQGESFVPVLCTTSTKVSFANR